MFLRMWARLPVAVRAVVAGCAVLTAGGLLTGPLVFANVHLWPEVPWSAPLLMVYLWFFWRYLRGRGWPRSTAKVRREWLRANSLSRRAWRWALTTGFLAMAGSYALHWVVGRFAPLKFAIPSILGGLPLHTLMAILLMASVIAGVVEEAAFRGFMQTPIERRHGVVVAIVIVSVVFGIAHLTDLQPTMTAARMFFIVLASVVYGILAHLTNSILPGVILHATGDAIGIVWIWLLSKRPHAEPPLLVTGLLAAGFAIASVWAFRRLAEVVKRER